MDKNTRDVINSLRRNGIAASNTPVRNGADYRMVQYINEQGERKLKIVKKDIPLQPGEKEFDFETFCESWAENAFGRPPEPSIDDEIDKIIREYQTILQDDENNNLLN